MTFQLFSWYIFPIGNTCNLKKAWFQCLSVGSINTVRSRIWLLPCVLLLRIANRIGQKEPELWSGTLSVHEKCPSIIACKGCDVKKGATTVLYVRAHTRGYIQQFSPIIQIIRSWNYWKTSERWGGESHSPDHVRWPAASWVRATA